MMKLLLACLLLSISLVVAWWVVLFLLVAIWPPRLITSSKERMMPDPDRSTRSWWDQEDGEWIHHTVVRCPGAQGQPTETTFRSGAWVSTVDLPAPA